MQGEEDGQDCGDQVPEEEGNDQEESAGASKGREEYPGGWRGMDRRTSLLLPGSELSVSSHGLPRRWRSHEPPHPKKRLVVKIGQILRSRDRAGYLKHPQEELHP